MIDAPPIRSLICMQCGARWIVGEPDECTCVTPRPAEWLDDPTMVGAFLRLTAAARRASAAFQALFDSPGWKAACEALLTTCPSCYGPRRRGRPCRRCVARPVTGFLVDNDLTIAAADVIGRMNAKDVEVGYLDEDAPTAAEARWWATARWNGTKVMVEDKPGPDVALDALARQLLEGGQCAHCGGRTKVGPAPKRAKNQRGVCWWTRVGARWDRGCTVPAGHRVVPKPTKRGVLPGRVEL